MPTTALYHWSVAGCPIHILIDLPLVDRLRASSNAAEQEIGGLLTGHFDGPYTVITDFELVESEHRRGPAYTLSKKDEARLAGRMEGRRRGHAVVVGYFRSHKRPGLYLDEGDYQVVAARFDNPSQVVLLLRPSADGAAIGGFFFWEDGEMNRKQTYLPFPMSVSDLQAGDFPLVEPVASAVESPVFDTAFANAETVDDPPPLPLPPVRTPVAESEPARSGNRKLTWPVIGLIAAGAAFAGYVVGTSGKSSDAFGARSGDITLNPAPEPSATASEQPSPASRVTPDKAPEQPPELRASEPAAASPSASTPAEALPPTNAVLAQSVPATLKKAVKTTPRAAEISLNAVTVQPAAPSPDVTARSDNQPNRVSADAAPESDPAPLNPPEPEAAAWLHFHQQPATSAAPPRVALNRQPLPPLNALGPVADASVYLETLESGAVSRAIGRIPLVGSFHHARSGDRFTPPRAIRGSPPKVPRDLARELTGTLPVDLKLTIGASGRVSSVELLSHQAANEFVRLAGDAAYDWLFEPARIKDRAVSSDVIAHFRFRPIM